MLSRYLNLVFLIAIIFLVAGVTRAQTADPLPIPETEQSESFRDTLVRMQIQREENEHKKRLQKATHIRELSKDLVRESESGSLPRSADKKLRDIEKAARQIRSELGGANDDSPLESPPDSLSQAVRQIDALSERFNASLEKTSRQIVSTAVLIEASEIIQLVKLIRGLL